jgi:hypothetical protein
VVACRTAPCSALPGEMRAKRTARERLVPGRGRTISARWPTAAPAAVMVGHQGGGRGHPPTEGGADWCGRPRLAPPQKRRVVRRTVYRIRSLSKSGART